jgi:uncharacterized SAM-binding protein YcdF (DUF218 family)
LESNSLLHKKVAVMDKKKFIIIVLILVIIIGLIGLGFTAVKMMDKWVARKAKADAAQKVLNCITSALPVKIPVGK